MKEIAAIFMILFMVIADAFGFILRKEFPFVSKVCFAFGFYFFLLTVLIALQ